jgi:hypothetical protein
VGNARTLARWAYLALSRRHWRRLERAQDAVASLSRTERLASVKAAEVSIEKKEEIEARLAEVRASVSEKVRRQAAASWIEVAERHRVAEALGTTDEESQALLDQTMGGAMRPNTVEQMRSRALRRMRAVIAESAQSVKALLVVGAAIAALGAGSRAWASGEQSGGRGGSGMSAPVLVAGESGGEQSGGRGG